MSFPLDTDTIAAIATPPGRGGVGIVRVSGRAAAAIGSAITGGVPLQPRRAHYGPFRDSSGELLDHGLALWFPAPHSFTGEDVLELHGHGGPVILDCLLREVIALGARAARPGEFSERAFLNNKIDLAQAEAIADLIDSASEQAARSAVRSLSGEFSRRVQTLVDELIELRIYVEAAIDFPDEEIDFLGDGRIAAALQALQQKLVDVQHSARQGALLREGITVVIAGLPNAGKSSLLNALAGHERAIVTPIAGTTRDVLREQIQIDGLPLHIIDTAGLRDTPDEVEREGVRRAWQEIERADHILLVVDSTQSRDTDPRRWWPAHAPVALGRAPVTVLLNKCDLSGLEPSLTPPSAAGAATVITLSAQSGAGLPLLRDHLKRSVGYQQQSEGIFSARRRHLDALERAAALLQNGERQLLQRGAGELLAEDLRQAQQALGEITGQFSPDELLGRIFSSFCIGK
jgi:tRNA modification GTPase